MSIFDASTAAELHPAALVLAELQRQATRYNAEIMVVGAVARDLLITQVVGSPPARATADVDIAIAVSSWPELHRLTEALQSVPGSAHKFLVQGTEVDVIPFGEIESDQRTITWSNDHMMNVFGFREALRSAVKLRLPGDLVIAVASLPAQSLLKLFAWRDRRYQDRRDAIDLKTILYSYHEGSYLDELYTAHVDLLEKHDFDPRLAGAERIGRESKALIATADLGLVTSLLFAEEVVLGLTADMGGRPAENGFLLSAYRDGLA